MVGPKKKILIIEPVVALASLYSRLLEQAGYSTYACNTAGKGQDVINGHDIDLLLVDLSLSAKMMVWMRKVQRDIPALILATQEQETEVEQAVRKGAIDYLVKPVGKVRLVTTVSNAVDRIGLKKLVSDFQQESDLEQYKGLKGSSMPMQSLYRSIRHVAPAQLGVFITGEPGTGKKLTARAIHDASNRAGRPFVTVNCATTSDPQQMENILFGTPMDMTRNEMPQPGALLQAHTGTLFLNNIVALDSGTQAKLLKYMKTGEVEGRPQSRFNGSDVRIICASGDNIRTIVQSGEFCGELFFQLNALPVSLPPLRMRGEDIVDLFKSFASDIAAEARTRECSLDSSARKKMMAYMWPGNVSELKAYAGLLQHHFAGQHLDDSMLPAFGGVDQESSAALPLLQIDMAIRMEEEQNVSPNSSSLEDLERWIIESRIRASGGSIPKAAESLGISPSTIYRKRDSWGRDSKSMIRA